MKIIDIYYLIYFLIGYFLFKLIYFKDIWVFLIGNLISNIVYVLLDVILINNENLQLIQKTLSWFLIEHIYEYYQKNTGKFFLTNRDFRQKLILNIFILLRNILFWSYFTTLFEFICLILNITFLSYILFLCMYYDTKEIKLNQFLFFTFYSLFLMTIFFKFYEFTYLDLYYILKPILFFIQVLTSLYCIIIYFYLILNFFFLYLSNLHINFLNLLFLICKTFFYHVVVILCLMIVLGLLILYHKINNNFMQEFFILILYVYSFILYYINFS